MNTPRLHHAMHHLHDDAVAIGHWCSMHLMHDYHFWLYLLVGCAIAAFVALMVFALGNTPEIGNEFRYFQYPYGTF